MKERIKEIKKRIQDYNMELAILEQMAEYEESIKPKRSSEPVIINSKPNIRVKIVAAWVFKGVAHIQPNMRKKEVVIC
jgi:hypothetical protein